MRLDSITAAFSPRYWEMKSSLTRKMGLLLEGELEPAADSSVHAAVDGDAKTVFRSAAPLMADDALVVDMQMIYHLSKLRLEEQAGTGPGPPL
jgi:hypothetical protein